MLYRVLKTSVYFRLFSISWLVVSVGALVATAAQKPIRHVDIHADGGYGAPGTLDELWERAAVVIDGRVVDVRPANETFTPTVAIPAGAPSQPVTRAQTDYVIEVRRVLKSDGVVTSDTATVTVRRSGGRVDRGEYIAEYGDSTFAKFKNRGRYVLFLEPAKGKQPSGPFYLPVVGADSAFEMLGDRVVPLGRAIASQQLAKLGVQQFVATLAKKGGK